MQRLATLGFLTAAALIILEVVHPESDALIEFHRLSDSLPWELHPSLWLSLIAGLIWFSSRPVPPSPIHKPVVTNPTPPSKSVPPKEPTSNSDGSDAPSDWKARILEAIDQMELESGVTLHVDRSQGIPFTYILDRCTPGRSRRALDSLGKFLAQVPRPPRVSILFRDCEKPNVPWQHLVSGALGPHIGRQDTRVVALTDRVDLIFENCDRCYTAEQS
jgi:hypothetical protein